MTPNPLLGVIFHWLGGLASASFYVPYRGVKRWSWEIFWLTGGLFSWLLAPWLFAAVQTQDLMGVMAQVPSKIVGLCVLFGVLWGFGGLTYGLTMRYLGLSLGMAVVLGLCTVFGTLIPPIVQGDFADKLLASASGRIILLGLVVTLAGIVVVAMAGARKDAALSEDAKKAVIAEFDFKKGVAVAVFSGVMSACFAFGLAAGEPIKALSAAAGTGPLWTGLPVLCLVMFGGLLTNGAWCAYLIVRNRSAGEWFGRTSAPDLAPAAQSSGASAAAPQEPARLADVAVKPGKPPLLANYLLCALAGTAWYFQFFFYTMGESQMGRFGFSSWTLHMASIIIFGTLWGFALKEWKDARPGVRALVWTGVALLIIATIIIGYGNMIAR
ncbi:L-rhamnose/proton symporter RhaT [Caulobacter segnis]|uniref:RhaT l-rhamnose-proton symport 2 n=2 Tax=Caulobacter segnis TaxID=88688 RepID=D5VGD1_CAUST|nr:L-rhamnose/proton symporter RhaT [Caulobacter segnis]ADG10250.1 RhaT l-rhamnose-proton symport 2 [Caulobacter segnis ATCC 21756]AVQ01989.1 L-rhamnose/proton symporter RhaT [Caulobacter segnis]